MCNRKFRHCVGILLKHCKKHVHENVVEEPYQPRSGKTKTTRCRPLRPVLPFFYLVRFLRSPAAADLRILCLPCLYFSPRGDLTPTFECPQQSDTEFLEWEILCLQVVTERIRKGNKSECTPSKIRLAGKVVQSCDAPHVSSVFI